MGLMGQMRYHSALPSSQTLRGQTNNSFPSKTLEVLLSRQDDESAAARRVSILLKGVLRTMLLSKVKILAAMALLMGATGTSAGLLTSLKAESAPPTVDKAKPDKPPTEAPKEGKERPPRDIVEALSTREGVLALIGTQIKKGEKVPDKDQVTAAVGFIAVRTGDHGDKDHTAGKEDDPLTSKKLFIAKEKRTYRKLHVGDAVEAGQLIGWVDQQPAILDLSLKIAKLETVQAAWGTAAKTRDEAIRRAKATELLIQRVDISEDTYRADLLNRDRCIEEEKTKDAARKTAAEEVLAAVAVLRACEIRSPVRGVVTAILKSRGEAVKNLETVVQIQEQRQE
jgi:hypothetical protein